MKLGEIGPAPGSRKRRKRVGRGVGSGIGRTSTRGDHGQKARSKIRRGFEGGQTPLYRRLPRLRGFKRLHGPKYGVVNVGALSQKFEEGSTIGPDEIVEAGLVKKELDGIRVLGDGEVEKKLKVKAAYFTAAAKEKLEKAGGTWQVTKDA